MVVEFKINLLKKKNIMKFINKIPFQGQKTFFEVSLVNLATICSYLVRFIELVIKFNQQTN